MEFKTIKKIEKELKKEFNYFSGFQDIEIKTLLTDKENIYTLDKIRELFKKQTFKIKYSNLINKELELQINHFNSQIKPFIVNISYYSNIDKEIINKQFTQNKLLKLSPLYKFSNDNRLNLDYLMNNLIDFFQLDYDNNYSCKELFLKFCLDKNNFKDNTNMIYIKNFAIDIQFFI
jgi:hypothetical protein